MAKNNDGPVGTAERQQEDVRSTSLPAPLDSNLVELMPAAVSTNAASPSDASGLTSRDHTRDTLSI